MDKKYSNSELLDMLKQYFEVRFNLCKNSNVIIFYNREFFFNCVDRESMSSVCKIKLDEIFESCNSVHSKDDKFESKKDLLDELNEMVECNSIVEYVIKYFEDKYKIMCLADNN